MKIWWGYRFGLDLFVFYLLYRNIVGYPRYLYRFGRSENVRWNQRRRPYHENPYFTPEADRKLKYDSRLNVVDSPVIV